MHLLKRRGYEAFADGNLSRVEFGKKLAQEWASLPVLTATKGAKRQVKRDQSCYAGDGPNKSLVKPEQVERVLDSIRKETPMPKTHVPNAVRRRLPGIAEQGVIFGEDNLTWVQQRLRELGYSEVGNVDGKAGPRTEAAILAFRNDNSLPLSKEIDDKLRVALTKAQRRREPPERMGATARDILRTGDPGAQVAVWAQRIGASQGRSASAAALSML